MFIFRLLWTKKIWVKWFTPQQMAFLCTIIHIMVRKIICHLWCLSCSKEFKNQLQWRSSVLCGQPTLEKMPTIPHSVCYLIKILQCPQQQGKCLAWLLCFICAWRLELPDSYKSKCLPATKISNEKSIPNVQSHWMPKTKL